MKSSYLPDIAEKSRWTIPRGVWLWLVLVGSFLLIWQMLSAPADRGRRVNRGSRGRDQTVSSPAPEPAPFPWGLILVAVAVTGAVCAVFVRRQRAVIARLQSAETKLLDDDIGGAIADAQAAAGSMVEAVRYRGLMVLAQCAERRAEFEEAATLYAQAPTFLRPMGRQTLSHSQFEPLADARRAFVLAAADRLEEAEAVLARPLPREAIPGTAVVRVRAQAVVDSKRRRYREVLDGLAEAHVPVRECLVLRDRLLLRAIAVHARMSLADPLRGAAEPQLIVDAPLADWIGRVVPSTRALFEGSS